MKPQTVRSRATWTLAKMESFTFAAPMAVISSRPLLSTEAGAPVGRLKDQEGQPEIDVFEKGIFLSKARIFAPYLHIRNAGFVEKTAELARTIRFDLDGRQIDFTIDTKTGRYRDAFDVLRFLLRCSEDATLLGSAGN